ncbi:MAG: MarC family protein [archaeon]
MYAEFLKVFLAIFVIVNPIGILPRFIALTAGQKKSEILRTTRVSVFIGCALLILFALAGKYILSFYGITTDGLRIAGGVLLFAVAFEMVFKGVPRTKHHPEGVVFKATDDVAVFPLAMPMLTGPGAITTVIILMQGQIGYAGYSSIIAAILLTYAIAFFLFSFSEPVHRLLGETGTNVLTKVFGILMAAISVEYIATGVQNKALALMSRC